MKSFSPINIRIASLEDIPLIQNITYKTWPVAYGNILSQEQLNYMLQLMYATEALQQQFAEGHIFYIAELNGQAVGFAAFNCYEKPAIYKLHKLYVLPQAQGSGAGKSLLQFVIARVKELKADTLLLNVNRQNTAINFYKKIGFTVLKKEDVDIGNGYFMNDYVMQLSISSGIPPLM